MGMTKRPSLICMRGSRRTPVPDDIATVHRIFQRMTCRNISLALSLVMASDVFSAESDGVTPWRQDQPPNPPYSPQEALSKMSVPEGFTVELVASEAFRHRHFAEGFLRRVGRIR